jgi:hypothetical protein
MMGGGGPGLMFGMGTSSQSWWVLAITTTACLMTMANLVLLAENRLSLSTENRVTPLRVGFLAQFLLIAAWVLSFVNEPISVRSNALQALAAFGCLHLALVAMFTVTEDLALPRPVRLRMKALPPWRRFLAMFLPGGGRGAVYVLMQMAMLLAAAWLLDPIWPNVRWFLAACGYICFFTGVPAVAFRLVWPGAMSFQLRVAVLLLVPLALVLPDLIYYVLWRPTVFNLSYSARHLINPFRTLANWDLVGTKHGFSIPFLLGLIGLAAYLALIVMGMRTMVRPAAADGQSQAAAAGEPDSADVLY